MPDEGFLRRWSRLKADGPAVAAPAAAPRAADSAQLRSASAAPALAARPTHPDAEPTQVLPTLDDVARLDANSDFSAFVSKGVDKDVRRLAMKKLFSDPHFNLVDRLDVYMDDYNKLSPMSAEMLAALHHTKNLFAPLAADKAAEPDADAAERTANDAGATVAQASGAGQPAPAAHTDSDAAIEAHGDPYNADALSASAQPESIPFDVAASSGVLQQTQQGKA